MQNGTSSLPAKEEGLKVEEHSEFPLHLFPVPSCYQKDLSAVLIPHGLIQDQVQRLAREIHARVGDKPLTMVCVLKGAFRFFTDLLRQLSEVHSSPLKVEFIRARSYEDSGSTGHLAIDGLEALEQQIEQEKEERHVLLVDDIVDTGLTLSKLVAELGRLVGSEGRVWTAVLVSKRTALRMEDAHKADFVAFNIPDKFIVGYGMDYNQRFRDLNHICVMSAEGVEKYRKKAGED